MGTLPGCDSGRWTEARKIAVISQKSFGFMAASIYRQWICHTPDVMKTDIFAARNAIESGKSTRGSIRFDSVAAGHGCRWAYSLIANHILRILKISQLFSDSWYRSASGWEPYKACLAIKANPSLKAA